KSDIAAELNISRFRVARLLEASRKTGLVRIVIEHEGSIDTDLSMLLQSTFDLAHAWGRSLSAIGTALTDFVPCPVVQLTGALSRPDATDVLELVRRVARV